MKKVRLMINGTENYIDVNPNETLLEVLRDRLKLKEVKVGCLSGECGACTVLLNGKAVNSCLILATEANGAEIVTVRGLSKNGKLHPLQRAFIEEGAIECGFCTPGFILTALSYLKEKPKPSIDEIKAAIAGNLCRCTGYQNIIKAIFEASREKYGDIK
jgi:carbon-monoxide dehydrogenase small subunit